MENLVMEAVSIIIQRSSNTLDSVVKNMFQFKCMNFVQKGLNDIKKIDWLSELLFCQCALHMAEKSEVRECQPGLLIGCGTETMYFSAKKASETFER
jgi:hypothetical protein